LEHQKRVAQLQKRHLANKKVNQELMEAARKQQVDVYLPTAPGAASPSTILTAVQSPQSDVNPDIKLNSERIPDPELDVSVQNTDELSSSELNYKLQQSDVSLTISCIRSGTESLQQYPLTGESGPSSQSANSVLASPKEKKVHVNAIEKDVHSSPQSVIDDKDIATQTSFTKIPSTREKDSQVFKTTKSTVDKDKLQRKREDLRQRYPDLFEKSNLINSPQHSAELLNHIRNHRDDIRKQRELLERRRRERSIESTKNARHRSPVLSITSEVHSSASVPSEQPCPSRIDSERNAKKKEQVSPIYSTTTTTTTTSSKHVDFNMEHIEELLLNDSVEQPQQEDDSIMNDSGNRRESVDVRAVDLQQHEQSSSQVNQLRQPQLQNENKHLVSSPQSGNQLNINDSSSDDIIDGERYGGDMVDDVLPSVENVLNELRNLQSRIMEHHHSDEMLKQQKNVSNINPSSIHGGESGAYLYSSSSIEHLVNSYFEQTSEGNLGYPISDGSQSARRSLAQRESQSRSTKKSSFKEALSKESESIISGVVIDDDVPVLSSNNLNVGETRGGHRVSENPQVSPIKEVEEATTPYKKQHSKLLMFFFIIKGFKC